MSMREHALGLRVRSVYGIEVREIDERCVELVGRVVSSSRDVDWGLWREMDGVSEEGGRWSWCDTSRSEPGGTRARQQ